MQALDLRAKQSAPKTPLARLDSWFGVKWLGRLGFRVDAAEEQSLAD